MAVWRSDQAQLTFCSEAAQGAVPENASDTADVSSATAQLVYDNAAGTTALACSSFSALIVAGGFVRIGAITTNAEVRKVEFVENTGSNAATIFVTPPTGYFHPSTTAVQKVTVLNNDDDDKLLTFIPGVYESVDVPDPDMALEPKYFLGTESRRNFYGVYKGQQTYEGALGNVVLLNGHPLRFPIGKVATLPWTTEGQTLQAVVAGISALEPSIDKSGGHKKGDTWISVSEDSGIVAGEYIVFYSGSQTTGSTSPWMPSGGSLIDTEVRKVVSVTLTNDESDVVRIDSPLSYDRNDNWLIRRVASTLKHYEHIITETVDLDSVSWHLHMRDSGETANNDFDRRYYGGKIGTASIAAEEGGLVTMGWDSVGFMGMMQNQLQYRSSSSTENNTAVNVPYYSLMHKISSGQVQFPTTNPYYFSQGTVKLFGETIARIRSFTLSINNNEEPRYYIQRRFGENRGPSEIKEQKREYSLSVSLALPDSGLANATGDTIKSIGTSLFKELLLEGDYGLGMRGFDVLLRFDRGDGDPNDFIEFRIPDDYTGTYTQGTGARVGGNSQGAFIRTAAHNIDDNNPLQVEADILFRSLKVVIRDSEGVYP